MLKERFLTYVSFDTQSDSSSNTVPSTLKQRKLGEYLVQELKSLGVDNAYLDEYGYVYGHITGTNPNITVGLIAHMDTAAEASGANVKPQIIANYQGQDIRLNDQLTLSSSQFPILKKYLGHELITTSGDTLLGADDKSGIAIIMETVARLLQDKHSYPNLYVVFTPDEEIGEGTTHFNYDLKMDFAYTLDGGNVENINFENFNAYQADVTIHGRAIHPGTAKGKMVNSIHLAMEFHSMLPVHQQPALTEKYEGFNHVTDIKGSVGETHMRYIIRNHSDEEIKEQIALFHEIAKFLNHKYGINTVEVNIKESYRNMRERVLAKHYVLEYAIKALKRVGIDPSFEPIRGGTDGARLTFGGIVCPNLGTGSGNHHGPYEFASVDAMNQMSDALIELLSIIALEHKSL